MAAVEDPGAEVVFRVDAVLAIPMVGDPPMLAGELITEGDAVEIKLELFNEDVLAPKEFEGAFAVAVDTFPKTNVADEVPIPEAELNGTTLDEVKEALEVVTDEFAERGIAEDALNVLENVPVPAFRRDVARVVAALDEGEAGEVCVAAN